MITATEARELITLSEKNITRLLDSLDLQIRAAAELGKRTLDVYEDLTTTSVDGRHATPKPTALMLKLTEEIKKFGFTVNIITETQEHTRGGWGICDDNDKDDISYSRICRIVISW